MRVMTAHQPNFAAFLGVWEKIFVGDVFVIMDDVDHKKRNNYIDRCRLITPHGPKWLKVPCEKWHTGDKINEVRPCKDFHVHLLDKLYGWGFRGTLLHYFAGVWKQPYPTLADLNVATMQAILRLLPACDTQFVLASKWELRDTSTRRLIEYCRRSESDVLWSGSGGARKYLDVQLFERSGFGLLWQDYDIEWYDQGLEPFDPGVSILDVLWKAPKGYFDKFADKCRRTRTALNVPVMS